MQMPGYRWLYRARYHSVVDGDTIRLEIDTGFYSRQVHPIRIADVDSPELYRGSDEEKQAGQDARQYVVDWLQAAPGWDAHLAVPEGIQRGGWVYLLETQGDKRTFNRYIGWVWRIHDGRCLNDDLVTTGHGVRV